MEKICINNKHFYGSDFGITKTNIQIERWNTNRIIEESIKNILKVAKEQGVVIKEICFIKQ